MAKALVKCLYCGKTFDRNDKTIQWVKPTERRYAHKKCYEKYKASLTQEQKDEEALYAYIKKILGSTMDYMKVKHQVKQFHDKYNFTYSGILSTLKYVFEIQHNPIEAAKGGIGIIQYKYEEAKQYYYKIYLAQQKIQVKDYSSHIEKITIESPRSWTPPQKLWFEEEDD